MSTLNGGPNTITNGLILYLDAANTKSYPGSGTVWSDLTKNNNSGSLTNGPTFNSANGGSIVFDGTNDYAPVGGVFTGLGTSNRTFDVWFQILSLSPSGNRRVLSFTKDDTSVDEPALTINYTTTNTNLTVGMGATPYDAYIVCPAFSLSTWINIIASITGNTLTVYQNGTLINTLTNTGAIGVNQIARLASYNAFYTQYGNVKIASLKVYNRALTSTEILQNYNATRTRFGL